MNRNLKNKLKHQRSKRPRSVQRIFDLMISKGYYDPSKNERLSSKGYKCKYMCECLCHALDKRDITYPEYIKVTDEISNYLSHLEWISCGSMKAALQVLALPSEPSDLIAIYSNWNQRPKIVKE